MELRDRFSELYERLRGVVLRTLRPRRRPEWTADDLLHEAYLKLRAEAERRRRTHRSELGDKSTFTFQACVGAACRDVLADDARRRGAHKRGGAQRHQELHSDLVQPAAQPLEGLDLRDALARLERFDPTLAWLVQARAIDGKTVPECARELGTSPRSVDRQWAFCRAWLQHLAPEADALPVRS